MMLFDITGEGLFSIFMVHDKSHSCLLMRMPFYFPSHIAYLNYNRARNNIFCSPYSKEHDYPVR